MNEQEIKLYLNSLLRAEVTISHIGDEKVISFNGFSELHQLTKQILDKKVEIDVDILNKIAENPSSSKGYKHYSHIHKKQLNVIFPIINGYTTARSISIHDNEKGLVEFEDLDDSTQKYISKFIETQKDYYKLHLDLLDEDEQDVIKTKSPLVFNATKQKTFFTKLANKIYNSDLYVHPANTKEDTLQNFVNELCKLFGIPLFQNLSSIISNIKKENSPFDSINEDLD